MSGVNINIHRVKEIRIEKTDKIDSESAYRKQQFFYTRDIMIVQDDGTKTTLDLFSDKLTDLIPVFKTEEEA